MHVRAARVGKKHLRHATQWELAQRPLDHRERHPLVGGAVECLVQVLGKLLTLYLIEETSRAHARRFFGCGFGGERKVHSPIYRRREKQQRDDGGARRPKNSRVRGIHQRRRAGASLGRRGSDLRAELELTLLEVDRPRAHLE